MSQRPIPKSPELESGKPGKSQRYAIGVFFDGNALESALRDLETSEFDPAVVHLLGGEVSWKGLFVGGPDLPRNKGGGTPRRIRASSLTGPVLASDGALADLMSGRAAEETQNLASRLRYWLGPRHAEALAGEIDRGGLQVWVRVRDSEEESRACRVLLRHSGGDVQVHDLHQDGASPEPTDSP